jgi:LPXTG-motif cell wall-anchored protein
MKTTKKMMGLMLAMMLILMQIVPAMASDSPTAGDLLDSTVAAKSATEGFSTGSITYSKYDEAGAYLSTYNENPSATTLADNLKAISSGVDTSILSGNVSVSQFFELNNDNGSHDAATVALNYSGVVDSSKGDVSAVYAYHYCDTHTRVELVTGTNLNTTDGTASFSFDALSPVALVVVYGKTEATTPAPEPAATNETTAATTTENTESTTESSTAPNTGANDTTALLMVVAVVALGAAVVVGKKKSF